MSRRIAHRPRYHFVRPVPHSSRHSSKDFLRTRWTYRRLDMPYQHRVPGQSLLHIPWGYKLLRYAIPLAR